MRSFCAARKAYWNRTLVFALPEGPAMRQDEWQTSTPPRDGSGDGGKVVAKKSCKSMGMAANLLQSSGSRRRNGQAKRLRSVLGPKIIQL